MLQLAERGARAEEFRRLAAAEGALVVPTAYDAMSARRAEGHGFKAVHVGGFLGAATLLGMPDVGLITASEAIARGENIANAISVPIILDVDTGFGNAINVIRTAQECVRGGVAAIHIEDQVFPKRCGQYGQGRMAVISGDEMAGKIRAIRYAVGNDLYVIARTDALGAQLSVDETFDRMSAYADAGADAVMVITRSVDNLKEVGRRWARRTPLATAPTRFPHISADELAESGYGIVLYTEVLARAAIKAVDEALVHLAAHRSSAGFEDRMVATEELYEIVRLPLTRDLEARFGTGID